MHNIKTNFRKFYIICKELFESEVNNRNNFSILSSSTEDE